MIEIKNRFHTQRLMAESLDKTDWRRAVYYANFRGDATKIPFYYHVIKGESAETDLTLPLEEIFSNMKSNTRNEIKRAQKEGCTFSATSDYSDFIPFYNSFCKSKGLVDRVDSERLSKYNGDNELLITKVTCNEKVLAMHANIINKNQGLSFLLFSCSQRLDSDVDKRLIGWANRFLHYKDLEYLKNIGIKKYDWSGVCTDPNDERFSISQFKLSFGGRYTTSLVLETPLFRFLLLFRSIIDKVRG